MRNNNHTLTNIWKTGTHMINIPQWMARWSSFWFSLLSLENFCKAKQKRLGDDISLTFNSNFVGYSLLHSQEKKNLKTLFLIGKASTSDAIKLQRLRGKKKSRHTSPTLADGLWRGSEELKKEKKGGGRLGPTLAELKRLRVASKLRSGVRSPRWSESLINPGDVNSAISSPTVGLGCAYETRAFSLYHYVLCAIYKSIG